MNINKSFIKSDTEISVVISEHPKALLFLEHFDVRPPVFDKSVRDICKEKNIREELFADLLNLYIGVNEIVPNELQIADIPTIIGYLHRSHRYYLDDIYPNIELIINNLHTENDLPEIKMVERFFKDYFGEVSEHLSYENEVAFPYIHSLYERVISTCNNHGGELQSVYSVVDYKEHHNDIEEKLDDLGQLLIKYLPLKEDGQVRRKLFFYLSELHYDLRVHSLIEDLILIPLVEKMELQIAGQKK